MNRWISPELLAAFGAAQTDAHRLFTSPQAWVERLGADVLISHRTHEALPEVVAGVHEWAQQSGFALCRIFSRFIPRKNAERVAPVLVEGEAGLPVVTTVQEAGVRYGIDFSAGYSAGLFIDQRANRAFLRRLRPGRVLNTFAYTCSFSVVAALEGAQTFSVDLSRKSIDRGRENFALNGLDPAAHRFLADDVLDVLPRLQRRGERFDVIILDPPTFSRGNRGRRWQVEQDMEDLVLLALELAAPKAAVLLSTNCARMNRRALEAIARFALRTRRLGGDLHQEPPLPDFPPGEGAQALWLRLH